MSTNTIIISCNGSLALLVFCLTMLPCTNKSTGNKEDDNLDYFEFLWVFLEQTFKL